MKDGVFVFIACCLKLSLSHISFPFVCAELFDELYRVHVFSQMDLKFGYHQLKVHTKDVERTAFQIHESHYEFLVMSFAPTNALATF